MKRVHTLLAVIYALCGAAAACGGLSNGGNTQGNEAGARPDTGGGTSGSGTSGGSSGDTGSGTSSGGGTRSSSSGPNGGSSGSKSSSASGSSGSGGSSGTGGSSSGSSANGSTSSSSGSSGGIGSSSSSASGSSSSSGSSGGNGSSGTSSGNASSSGSGTGETILFPFSQSTDVPGGNLSTCPNQMKGCWFWDDYNPACSIPLGNSEAGAGDGAPCSYPNVQPILSFDSAVGDTNPAGDPGSMRVQVPFTAYNQQALVEWIFAGTPLDWSHKTLFARLRFDSGGNPNLPSNPNGFRLIVKTGTGYVIAPSSYFNLIQNGQTSFTEYDFPLTATPAGAGVGWDATQVVAIELEFDTGGGPVAGIDAGAPATATFHIDTIGTVP